MRGTCANVEGMSRLNAKASAVLAFTPPRAGEDSRPEWGLPAEDFSNYVTVVMRIGAGLIGGLPRLTPRAK
jgi:hypothetical protein